MAQFPGITLTNAGLNMIAESQATSTALIFTSLKMGDGTLTVGEDIKLLTAVKKPLLTVPPESHTNSGNGQVRLRFAISNGTLETGFFARELGIYAKVGTGGTEQLYAYTNAGNLTDYIPDKNTPIDEQIIDIYLVVGNASSVAIVSDGSIVYVSKAEFDDHKSATDAHADLLNMRKNSTAYVVGDCKRSATMESWKYAECTVAGTTAATEPTWGDVGSTVTDGGVTWIVRDKRVATDAADNSGKKVTTSWLRTNIQSLVSGCIAAVATAAGFACSLSTTGYIKLPTWLSGLIIQWGYIETSATADTVITYPITFQNAVYSVVGMVGSGAVLISFVGNGTTLSDFKANAMSMGGRNAVASNWIAIGK